LSRERRVEAELGAQALGVGCRRGGGKEERRRVAGSRTHEHEREGDDHPEQQHGAGEPAKQGGHAMMMAGARGRSTVASGALAWAGLALASLGACVAAERPEGTVVYASGADLEGANPLVTVHPLSRQVQRYALFVTLARYDSALVPRPYLARGWSWSPDRRTVTLRLEPSLRWHDGRPTTARDVAFTLAAARDPATGYARAADLAGVREVVAADDTTLAITFGAPQPSCRASSASCRSSRRTGWPDVDRARSGAPRSARAGRQRAVPLRGAPGRRALGVRAEPGLSGRARRPAAARRLVVAVVDEATTKFAAS
jgi:peptide/nickel transport system substrate-binding protein